MRVSCFRVGLESLEFESFTSTKLKNRFCGLSAPTIDRQHRVDKMNREYVERSQSDLIVRYPPSGTVRVWRLLSMNLHIISPGLRHYRLIFALSGLECEEQFFGFF